MTRAWIAAAVLGLAGCSGGDAPEVYEPLAWTRPATCGDRVCGSGELRALCPGDCLAGELRLRREVDACAGARSPRETAEILEVGLELAESIATLPGGLRSLDRFARALERPYATLAGDELLWFETLLFSFDATTATYRMRDPLWDGAGEVTATFGRSYAAFPAGTRVPHDLFDPASYLIGARVTDSGIAYDRVGPLVELLGQGTTPPNPMVIGAAAGEHFAANTYAFRLARVRSRGPMSTTLTLRGELRPGQLPELMLESNAGRHQALQQTARVTAFDVRSRDCNTIGESCRLDGSATIEVADGPMPYQVVVAFAPQAGITVRCPSVVR